MINKLKDVMNTTPEEKVVEEISHILMRIKEESLASPRNSLIFFRFNTVVGAGLPSKERQNNILHKLYEEGAIELRDGDGGLWLKILQPRFDQMLNDYDNPFTPASILLSSSNNINKLVVDLSFKNIQRFLKVLSKLKEICEMTPTGDAMDFAPTTYIGADGSNYNERTILKKLEEWKVLEYEDDDFSDSLLVFSNLEKLGNIEAALKTRLQIYAVKKLEDDRLFSDTIEAQSVLQKAEWSDEFQWEEDNFVFGANGKLHFSKGDRKDLFRKLSDAKGNWVGIGVLKGRKDVNYVRATIRQIELRFKDDINKHFSIPSTQEDNLEGKPQEGAYRLKFVAKT